MTSLKEDFLILIYEKEKLLNSILHYQISNYNNYKVLVTDDKIFTFESLSKKSFDTCIINLNYFDEDLKKLLDLCESNNNVVILLVIMTIISKTRWLIKVD